jgi:NAD(P)-dependent dehydrogenase (short-subunit alcohol dehydrogenase family)
VELTGGVCVVTGASSGIGRRTALDLAAEGARVCVVARRGALLDELLAELGGGGEGHSVFVCDVADRDQVRALADHVGTTYQRCDVLVNSAGYSDSGAFEGPDDIDRLEQVMAVNFYGTVYCTGELLPLIEQSAPSSIVNISSMAGRLGLGGSAPYCASKFAVCGFSESLHLDLASRGVCVSLIEPGLIPTDGFPHAGLQRDAVMQHALGTVEDVTAAIIDAIRKGRAERVVPRWYHLLQLPRIVAPPLYRLAAVRLNEGRKRRREENSTEEGAT